VWGHLPEPARRIAVATADAVAAAGTDGAGDALAALDPQQVKLVLGAVVRLLVEELHPDGLDADDITAIVARCAAAYPAADPQAQLVLLAGALGIHPDAEETGPVDVPRQASLLIADLLAVARRPLTRYLEAAFAEIARGETMDLP